MTSDIHSPINNLVLNNPLDSVGERIITPVADQVAFQTGYAEALFRAKRPIYRFGDLMLNVRQNVRRSAFAETLERTP